MIAVPAATPVTTPVLLTVALELPLLHDPPEVAQLNVMVAVSQTVDGPVRAATVGSGLTVMPYVAVAAPQLLVTV